MAKGRSLRIGDKIDGEHGIAAHRIDITERVCRGDGAEFVGRVDDRREKVGGGNDRFALIELVDGCVVRLGETHQDLRKVF